MYIYNHLSLYIYILKLKMPDGGHGHIILVYFSYMFRICLVFIRICLVYFSYFFSCLQACKRVQVPVLEAHLQIFQEFGKSSKTMCFTLRWLISLPESYSTQNSGPGGGLKSDFRLIFRFSEFCIY